MLANDEVPLVVLVVMGGIACVLGGVVTLWYYIKYIRATKIYLRTRDFEVWSNSIKRIGIKTALAVFFLAFVASEACILAFMVDAELVGRSPAMLRNGVISGVVISLLLASFVLFHARWQDIMKGLVRLLRSRQSSTEEAESACDRPEV